MSAEVNEGRVGASELEVVGFADYSIFKRDGQIPPEVIRVYSGEDLWVVLSAAVTKFIYDDNKPQTQDEIVQTETFRALLLGPIQALLTHTTVDGLTIEDMSRFQSQALIQLNAPIQVPYEQAIQIVEEEHSAACEILGVNSYAGSV